MKEITVKITFTEEILGTAPNDEEIYANYIASKAIAEQGVTKKSSKCQEVNKMCEICRSNQCDARCPNASEPKIMGNCALCGETLREDYTYFKDGDGNIFCNQECAVKYHNIEEKEWDNG